MSSDERTDADAALCQVLAVEGQRDYKLQVEAGPEPWTWLVTFLSNAGTVDSDLLRRHLQMADIDVMLQGDFVDRVISGGGILLLRKVDSHVRFRIIAPKIPDYCPPSGHLGDVSWQGLLEAVNELERKRKCNLNLPTVL